MARWQPPGDPWRYVTWEGAELANLLHGRSLSMLEKLDWLEEMSRVVEHLQGRAKARTRGRSEAVDCGD